MNRIVLGALSVLLASSAMAQTANPVTRATPYAMELGTQFQTLFVSCGTERNPECPRFLEPLGRPFLIHYVTVAGRSDGVCSVAPQIMQVTPDGGDQVFGLARLVLFGDAGQSPAQLSEDSMVLTLARPIRVGPADTVGVARSFQDTGVCATLVMFGIELVN